MDVTEKIVNLEDRFLGINIALNWLKKIKMS